MKFSSYDKICHNILAQLYSNSKFKHDTNLLISSVKMEMVVKVIILFYYTLTFAKIIYKLKNKYSESVKYNSEDIPELARQAKLVWFVPNLN